MSSFYSFTSGYSWRLFHKHNEVFGLYFGWGLGLTFEMPYDNGENNHATLYLSLLFFKIYIMFPWYKVYPDHHQAQGPRYGFDFALVGTPGCFLGLYWGQDTGVAADGKKYLIINGPWSWGSCYRHVEGEQQGPYAYMYERESGEVQHRTVMVKVEERSWRRFWIPSHVDSKTLWCDFNEEIGENVKTWKGGVTGAGIKMLPDESALDALKRMQETKKFKRR